MPRLNKLVLLVSFLSFCIANNTIATENELYTNIIKTGFLLNSFPDISRTDLEVAVPFWVEGISNKVGIQSETYLYTNVDKMRDDFLQDKINFIVAAPLSIAEKFDNSQLTEGYKIVWGGQAVDSLLVVTHKQSGLNDFSKVKNQQLSLLANDPISDMYANILALENFGMEAKPVFRKINYMRKSSQLILKLFFKNTDVIFVYKGLYNLTSELNPQIRKNTQVIAELPGITRALGFFHPRVNPQFRDAVLIEVERLNAYPAGQQLLELFQADKTIRSSVEDLNSVKALKQRYLQLISKRCHVKQ